MFNLDEDQTALKVLVTDTYDNLFGTNPNDTVSFKLIKGKNGTTTFLPLNTYIGGPVKYVKDKETICLTKDQARLIYEKGRIRRHS